MVSSVVATGRLIKSSDIFMALMYYERARCKAGLKPRAG
jgi:hypothetical protein